MSTKSIDQLVLTWFRQGSDTTARRRAEQLLAGKATPRLSQQYAARGLGLFRKPAVFTEELLTLAEVDLAHARQVADHALALFDACASVLGLTPRQRQVLEHMALLHNVGMIIDEPRHHLAGRDVLLAVRLLAVTPIEQRVIACGVRFHRKAVRPREEPLFVGLPIRWQTPTLLLSGLLRIADGLDYSTTQTTRISACVHDDDGLHLTVLGLHAVEDARRALAKADLWQVIAHEKVEIHVTPDLEAFAGTIVTAESPLLSAFQLGLADQLRRWRGSVAGAQADDQRDLKALRAAARRSNAALWVFGACFRPRPIKALRRRLKLAEKALGEVRDWDLAIDEAEEAFEGQDNGLLKDWRRQRRKAHKRATAWFQSEVDSLRTDLENLLVEPQLRPEAGAPSGEYGQAMLQTPLKRLRRAFARLDRDDALPALHEVRLALKRLRFTVELLVPLYGEPASALLPAFIRAQDRLGGINDLHVAHNRVLNFLSRYPGESDALDYARLLAAQIKKQLGRVDADLQPLRPDVIAVEFSRWGTGRSRRSPTVMVEDDSEVA